MRKKCLKENVNIHALWYRFFYSWIFLEKTDARFKSYTQNIRRKLVFFIRDCIILYDPPQNYFFKRKKRFVQDNTQVGGAHWRRTLANDSCARPTPYRRQQKEARIISPVVQHCCRGCFSVADAEDANGAGKGEEKEEGRVERRRSVRDHYFPTCVVHRDGDAGEQCAPASWFKYSASGADTRHSRSHGYGNLRRSHVRR